MALILSWMLFLISSWQELMALMQFSVLSWPVLLYVNCFIMDCNVGSIFLFPTSDTHCNRIGNYTWVFLEIQFIPHTSKFNYSFWLMLCWFTNHSLDHGWPDFTLIITVLFFVPGHTRNMLLLPLFCNSHLTQILSSQFTATTQHSASGLHTFI
jgi:hypothetical protein